MALKNVQYKQKTNLILGGVKFRKGYEIYVVWISDVLYALLFSLIN